MCAARPSTIRAGTRWFAPFRLDPVNECLWRRQQNGEDERLRLTPKAYAVLRYLVDHAGRLVSQNELVEAVWADTYVQPEVVKSQITDVRNALGDDPKNPRFIETVPKRGYRFIARVEETYFGLESVYEPSLSKVVGRRVQMHELRNCLERSLANQSQIVFITGETGIGKTALADEFVRQCSSALPGLRVARGQCAEGEGYGSKEAYYPMLQALFELCGGPDGDSVVRTLSTQAPTWLVQFPALVGHEERKMFEQEIAGASRARMLREIVGALDTIASERPLLLVFEDLHWAAHSTVDLISALARRRGSGKLMLIGIYRPVDVAVSQHPLKAVKQDLLVHQLCRELAPKKLTEADVLEYLVAEARGAALPEGLAALVYRHCEGNPLFMVDIIDHLQNRSLISQGNGSWQMKVPLESIHLETPESLRQLIKLQMERLSPEEQRVLEIASVTGSLFTTNVEVLGTVMDQEQFEVVCEELSRRQLMVRWVRSHRSSNGAISQCYDFAHVLYREVFYRRQARVTLGASTRHRNTLTASSSSHSIKHPVIH